MPTTEQKTALVTGATSGIGTALSRALARRGWRVLLHGRDPAKLEATSARVARLGAVTPLEADLSDLGEVRRLAAEVRGTTDRLDALLNNAGVAMPSCRMTPQHIETTMAVNAVAPFVLFQELRGMMSSTAEVHGGARLVNVSSAAHRRGRFTAREPEALAAEIREPPRGYNSVKAYAQSKLALTAWTMEAARRLDGSGVVAHVCHPGVVRTRIFGGVGGALGFFATLFSVLYLPPSLGAKVPLALATAPEFGERTGVFLRRSHLRGPHEAEPPVQATDTRWTSAAWGAMDILARAT